MYTKQWWSIKTNDISSMKYYLFVTGAGLSCVKSRNRACAIEGVNGRLGGSMKAPAGRPP